MKGIPNGTTRVEADSGGVQVELPCPLPTMVTIWGPSGVAVEWRREPGDQVARAPAAIGQLALVPADSKAVVLYGPNPSPDTIILAWSRDA